MNDQIQEQEFLPESNKSNFKITVGNSLVVAFIIVLCLQVLSSFISIPSFFWENFNNITLPLSFLVGGAVAIYALVKYLHTDWKSVAAHIWKPVSLGVVFLSILFYVLMLPFAEFLTTMVPTEGDGWLAEFYKQLSGAFELMLNYKVAGFITVCILAPIIEEILFRGILLRGLLQNGTSPILAISLSAVLFGMAHLNPWQFLGAGLLGAVFGFIYYRTQSLWLCMLLHALNNSVSFILMLKYKTMDENVTNPNDYISVFSCFLLAVIVGWVIYKLTKYKISWN